MFKNIDVKKSTHEQKTRTFLDFSYAEFSSAIEMLQAAKLTNNKNLSKGFIDHSLDEYKHTRFFLKSLDTFLGNENYKNKYKFDTKLVYKLGFINDNYFLFSKYTLNEFSMFIAINEAQALKVFTKIKKLNFIDDIKDQIFLDKIISEEEQHLLLITQSEKFVNEYDDLLKDEKKHVTLSRNFSKKNLTKFYYKFLSFKFILANKIRHLFSKNKKINSFINYIISIIIIILIYPLKRYLNDKEKTYKVISFSHKNSKLML